MRRKQRGKGFVEEVGFGGASELYYLFMTIAGIAMIVALGLFIALVSMTSISAAQRVHMRNALIAMSVITILALFGAIFTGGNYYGTY